MTGDSSSLARFYTKKSFLIYESSHTECLLCGGGKRNGDGGAQTESAFEADGAAVGFDDALADREAEARAAGGARAGGVRPVEALADMREMLRRHSLAGILDGDYER